MKPKSRRTIPMSVVALASVALTTSALAWFCLRTPTLFSPCTDNTVCLWSVWTETTSGSSTASRIAISVDDSQLPDVVETLDTLHGTVIAANEITDDNPFFSPDESDEPDETENVSSEHEALLQQAANTLWNNGGIRVRGVLAFSPNLANRIPLALARFFLRDTDYFESLVATRFPGVEFAFEGFPTADVSARENLPSRVHHVLAQVSVSDLYDFYEELCAAESTFSVCNWIDDNGFGPLPFLDTLAELAGASAAFDVDVYWTVREGQILWANTPELIADTTAWNPSKIAVALENASLAQKAAVTQGVWLSPAAWLNTWQATRETVDALSSGDREWKGFLAFPDLPERLETLSEWLTRSLGGSAFSLSVSTGERVFLAKILVQNNSSSTSKTTEFSATATNLQKWVGVLLPEVSTPSPASFVVSRLPEPLTKWNGLSWEPPLSELPVSVVWRLALAHAQFPPAFD